MNLRSLLAGAFTVLAVTLIVNCSSGSSGNGGSCSLPTDPTCNPRPDYSLSFIKPVMNLTIAEGDTIFCDVPTINPTTRDYFPEWWLSGSNEWMKVRGDSILSSCGQGNAENRILRFNSTGGPVMPPAGDYEILVHAKLNAVGYGNPGGITATEKRPIHILPKQE